MARKVFYSFQYTPDNWRVAMVRNIGTIEGNRPASDNDWETVSNGGESAIINWIDNQMIGKSCTVVLVGANTANRKWINYEIRKSWDRGMGIVGIYIHGLKNREGQISTMGNNPFDHIKHGKSGKKLSEIVKCYNPSGINSQEKYAWISKHLSNAVEEAMSIRAKN